MIKFNTYGDLTDHIMFAINERVSGSQIGVSSRSVSRYVTLEIEGEDNDPFSLPEIETRRIRISDHDATASCGGDIVFEIDIRDLHAEEIYDDCGEFSHIEVSDHRAAMIEEMINEAVEALTA